MVEGNGTSDTMFERGFQNLFLVATIASDYTRSRHRGPRRPRRSHPTVIAHEDTSFATGGRAGGRGPATWKPTASRSWRSRPTPRTSRTCRPS